VHFGASSGRRPQHVGGGPVPFTSHSNWSVARENQSTDRGVVPQHKYRHAGSGRSSDLLSPWISIGQRIWRRRYLSLSFSRSCADLAKAIAQWLKLWRNGAPIEMPFAIVCKVGRMLICCTGAGTHNFQIASERVQYRLKWHVLGPIRPLFTLQNFQYSIETIFAF